MPSTVFDSWTLLRNLAVLVLAVGDRVILANEDSVEIGFIDFGNRVLIIGQTSESFGAFLMNSNVTFFIRSQLLSYREFSCDLVVVQIEAGVPLVN